MVIGYSLLLLLILTYAVVIGAAQVIGGKTNMFVLNVYRFVIQASLGISWVIFGKHAIKVDRKDWYKVALSTIFNYVKGTLFYLAAAVLPVGNMDGTYTGLYMICTTCIDLVLKEISKISILVSLLAIVGVTMLTQPWQEANNSTEHHLAPCDYMDGVNWTTDAHSTSNASVNGTLETTSTWFGNPIVIGYFFVVASAISAAIASNATRAVLRIYTVPCGFFWTGTMQCVVSIIIVIIMKLVQGDNLSMLPNGGACIEFTALFLLGITITSTVANFVYKYLPISKVAVAKPFSVVTLYVLQKTLLHQFFPGFGNVVEIFGIILIFLAGIISPFVTILYESTFR